jgi:hypothetical protein
MDANANGVAARWTGVGWDKYSVATAGGSTGNLAAASPSRAWLVGEDGNDTGTVTRDVVNGWDGSAWAETRVPNPSPTDSRLFGVAAAADSAAWAVGTYKRHGTSHALALRWDGSGWSQVTAPGASLSDVTAVPGSDEAWAVGWTGEIERYRCS